MRSRLSKIVNSAAAKSGFEVMSAARVVMIGSRRATTTRLKTSLKVKMPSRMACLSTTTTEAVCTRTRVSQAWMTELSRVRVAGGEIDTIGRRVGFSIVARAAHINSKPPRVGRSEWDICSHEMVS